MHGHCAQITSKSLYWNARGASRFQYNGEDFYTITPIPFYVRRRRLLLQRMNPLLAATSVRRVCDFGCGDGWYLRYFKEQFPEKSFWGTDVSEEMIRIARTMTSSAGLAVSDAKLCFHVQFDLIYCVAVLAHVRTHLVDEIFRDIYDHLRPGGQMVFFEQVGPDLVEGEWWCRRPSSHYRRSAAEAGFRVESETLIAFPLFNLYERLFEPVARRVMAKGNTYHERCINANCSKFLNAVRETILSCSGSGIVSPDRAIRGNCLFVVRKPQERYS